LHLSCSPRSSAAFASPRGTIEAITGGTHTKKNIPSFVHGTFRLTQLNLQVVIIQPVDNGNKPHPFGHAVVAGIERYPEKITRRMSKTRQEKRSKIKPFIKVINYNHLMPTRYTLELEGLKGSVSGDTFKEVSQREDAKKNVKKVLEERYTSGKNRWFFTPLSMCRTYFSFALAFQAATRTLGLPKLNIY
jgi:large subunit ribosomal protein L27e